MKLFLRNAIWWVSHGTGEHRIRQSTGHTDRELAEQVAKEICAPAMLRREADIVEMAGKIASGKRLDAQEKEADRIPLSECRERFPWKKTDGSDPARGSLIIDERMWRKFVEFCETQNVRYVHEVTPKIAEAYLASVTPGSRGLAYLCCHIRFNNIGVEVNPFRKKPRRDPKTVTHREPLERDEVTKILEFLDNSRRKIPCGGASQPEFAMYIRFLVYTGLRIGDAATMKVSQCDFTHGILRRRVQKTGKMVEFPMFRILRQSLPRHGEYLFPAFARICADGRTVRISARIRVLLQKLGLYRGRGIICAHSFRHTFGMICCEEGIPLVVVQDWLGHSSPEITRIYTHYNDMKRKQEIVDRFPEF